MSFWTNVKLVRPGPPPRLTVGALLRFVERVAQTGIVHDPAIHTFQVKFGKRIDADYRDTSNDTEVLTGVFKIGEYDWDINVKDASEVKSARDQLLNNERTIYRAYVGFDFCSLAPAIGERLHVVRDDGSPNLLLADVSVRVDVLTASSLGTERVHVGWIGVGFGGQGYLFPWGPKDLLSRIAEISELRAVEACCRDAFPVPAPLAGGLLSKYRYRRNLNKAMKELGDFWPFSEGIPSDWAWAISET